MPNFNNHININIFSYPLVIAIYSLFVKIFDYPLPPRQIVGWGFILFVISGDLPDIDHASAVLRKIVKLFVIFTVFYFEFTRGYFIRFLGLNYLHIPYSLQVLVAILVASFIGKLFDFIIPKHRGPLHRIWSAFVYGLSIFYGYYYLFSVMKNAIFLGIISTIGYLIHIFLDKNFREVNGRLKLKRKGKNVYNWYWWRNRFWKNYGSK
ncbi:metal-dependent hydrolase [Thermosipho atlanticus]|uniref:LexA-binding, inner membrane-associated putative hydrolase n=1 Tax=Thermosipho atlanticus DSM 15807 TaxID=1123380 RepID=A0A1M5QXZ7_9BACT|nr:metal-dependent hydrolase [Thermosipho atlanticus]SHH18811.1 LexA-binding, inner membrane-associated putative hydrolase [Thermosipho atlanticus DSM 15807]